MPGPVTIPDNIFEKAESIGIEHARTKLPNMVRLAARVTSPLGNFRYEDVVFSIYDGFVHDIDWLYEDVPPELEVLSEHDDATVTVVCPTCADDGQWCEVCRGVGTVRGSLSYLETLRD